MKRRTFDIAVLVSLVVHLLLIFLLNRFPAFNLPEKVQALEVFLEKPDGGWQIADIPPPEKEERPDRSDFLGMYDQKVQQETVRPEVPKVGERARKAQPEEKKPKVADKKRKSADFYAFSKEIFKDDRNEVSEGHAPTPDVRALEDFYPDYKLGTHTYINVMRYPDVEYFVRLKRIFKMTWDPVSALRREMPTSSVARGMVSVVMAVSVGKSGELSELFVIKSSGLAAYDNEALRTVRASSPFAAPPEKLLEKDGVLRMSWTFTLYV